MERRERLRNIQKWKMHSVQNYCFLLSNMQICDFLAVVVFRMLAWAPYYKTEKSPQLLLSEVCDVGSGMFVSSCCRGFNVYGQSDITQLVYWIAHLFHRNARMVRRSRHSDDKYSRQSFPFFVMNKVVKSGPARRQGKCVDYSATIEVAALGKDVLATLQSRSAALLLFCRCDFKSAAPQRNQ